MSELPASTTIQGIAYIMWVKETDDASSPDAIYAVVHKGNSKFGYQDFEYVCKVSNKKYFICNKINDGKADSTWEDCLYELKVKREPKGNPMIMTNRAYTFSEVAAIAYREKFFTCNEGLQHIAKKTKPSTAPVAIAKKQVSEEYSNILDDAKAMSDNLDEIKAACSNPLLKNPIIPGSNLKDHDTSKEVVDVELDEDLENMKERVALAESSAEELQVRNDKLEALVAELNVKLASSIENQKHFMAAGDKVTADLELLNEDTADKVAKKLESKLCKLESFGASFDDIRAKIDSLSTAMSCQTEATTAGFDQLVERVDNSNQALSEGIMATNDTLDQFGLACDKTSVDIPGCIKAMASAPPKPPSTKVCEYRSRNMKIIMACKCGCGYELQLDQVNQVVDDCEIEDHGAEPAAGVESGDKSGQHQTSKRGFSIDRTGGGNHGQHAYAQHQQQAEHQYQQQGRNVPVMVAAPPHPHLFDLSRISFTQPPPFYVTAYQGASVATPDKSALDASESDLDGPPKLNRKQKKAIKNKEYHAAKKLRLSAPQTEIPTRLSYRAPSTSGTVQRFVQQTSANPSGQSGSQERQEQRKGSNQAQRQAYNPPVGRRLAMAAATNITGGRMTNPQVWSNTRLYKSN